MSAPASVGTLLLQENTMSAALQRRPPKHPHRWLEKPARGRKSGDRVTRTACGPARNYPESGIGCTATSRKAANRPDAWSNFWPNMTQKASPTGCRGCVCGPCRARDSSRAAEWPAVNSDWARIRYTWRDISTAGATVQVPKLRLHGYVSKGLWRQLADLFNDFATVGSRKLGSGDGTAAVRSVPCGVPQTNSLPGHPGDSTEGADTSSPLRHRKCR